MRISVVTPNYNYGRFLDRAIRSVFQQIEDSERLEVEHIVVDGGSSDETLDLLSNWESHLATVPKALRDRYLFRWKSEPDDGQTDAINKGLRMASGDVVCWLNSDEYYLPGKLESVHQTFEQNPAVDFVHGEVMFVDADNRPIRIKRDHPFSLFVLQWYGCFIPSCCAFWRRRILEEGAFLDPSYKVVMDYEYWLRLAKLGYRFRFIPVNIAAFMYHDSNVSSVMLERRRSERLKLQMLYGRRLFKSNRWQILFMDSMTPVAIWFRRMLVVLRLIFRRRDRIQRTSVAAPVLLMTASVDPRGCAAAMFSPEQRARQYKKALVYYRKLLQEGWVKRIVFCENSGWGLSQFKSLFTESQSQHVEFLSLDPDLFIPGRGKSYNEMLMIDCVLKKSTFLSDPEEIVIKVTGRYPIINIRRQIKDLSSLNGVDVCYSVWPRIRTKRNLGQPPMIDTRCFAFRKKIWVGCFQGAYSQADNATHQHFETIVFNIVRQNRLCPTWYEGFTKPLLILSPQGHWKKFFGIRIPKCVDPAFMIAVYCYHRIARLLTNEWSQS